MNNSNLDERQEQALLKIEHNGCWFAFWALFASLAIQFIMYGPEEAPKLLAGEWIVFMCLALYLSFACLRKGIWDRRLKPNIATNIVVSIIGSIVAGAVFTLMIWKRYPDKPMGALGSGVFIAILVFAMCFILLMIMSAQYKKKKKELEEEPEDDIE